jgi:hypothetical protein
LDLLDTLHPAFSVIMSLPNPRRRAPVTRLGDSDDAATHKTTMTLRKGATFHSRPSSSNSSFIPPCLSRSQTHLDDVVDANRRRIAMTLSDVDEVLAKAKDLTISPKSPKSSTKKPLKDTSLPIPRAFLDLPVVDPAMAKDMSTERRVLRPRSVRRSKHASDSGLGSSVASTQDKADTESLKKKTKTSATAITRSAASANMDQLPALSRRAVNRIHEHTLTPLLEAETLKDFQPIILDVPRRIRSKDIICLRDLEKTLVFMAPERAKSATLYLDFCLQSIRCIQATVEYVSEREQIRPGDRPYTNGYFIDLKEQIYEYARELASVKDKNGLGDEMDIDSLDEIRLHGGIAENGRPAELIRVKKDGSAISLATGKPVDTAELPAPIKRSLSEQRDDEEEIMRSMARRKKNATAEELAPKKCREPGCNKEFKRPCDLTKHEKTHSRPWKCPIPTCKYHEFGWPTEKEMGRHLNDKHSDAPAMFECMFKPCPYKSKRESNCKQHMEKAHGWTYVRTKTPANKKVPSMPGSSVQQQPTPPLGNASTPSTTPAYSVPTPPQDNLIPIASGDFPAYAPHEDWVAQLGMQQEWDPDLVMENQSPSSAASYEALPPYQNGSAFILNDEDIYAANAHIAQMPLPEHMAMYAGKMMPQQQQQQLPIQPYQMPNCQPVQANAPHFSPSAQQNAMLYTPNSLREVDDSFDDGIANGDGIDFTLFPASMNLKADPAQPMFADAPSAGLGFSQTSQQDMFLDWNNMANFPLQE